MAHMDYFSEWPVTKRCTGSLTVMEAFVRFAMVDLPGRGAR
jgi:hypothetical protein